MCVCVRVCMFSASSLSIHSLTGCFDILAIVNDVAVNMGVQIVLQDPIFFLKIHTKKQDH